MPEFVNIRGVEMTRCALNPLQKEEEFDRLLADCAVSTISGVLGDTAADALIFHLALLKENLRPADLSSRLEKILGSGSIVIETLIVKSLSLTLGDRVSPAGHFRFASTIETMRKEFVG